MFKKDTSEKLPVDVNRIILGVLAIARIDFQKNGVELGRNWTKEYPSLRATKSSCNKLCSI